MTADRAKKLAKENFPCIMDNPFSDLSATVIRHSDSRKWFGLIMEVDSSKFGLFPERKLFCVLSVNVSADGDNYKTWLQTDSRWGSIGFGYNDSYTVARVGCALTSVAKVMAYSGAVSRDTSVFNPGVLCNFLKANGGFTSSGDIYWAKPCEYTSNFTLEKWTNVSGTKDEKISQIISFLFRGCMVV